jgi:general secretion pathway protein D
MQDRLVESVSKVPLLGDIPVLGNLFRSQTRQKIKTNLLLFLTPYIIRDSSDFRRIFERKLKERQQFVEQFYGATTSYDVVIDFARKPGPLARMSQILNKELRKAEHGGPGGEGERIISPQVPPSSPRSGLGPAPETTPVVAPEGTPAPPVPVEQPSPEMLKVQPELQ